MPLHLADAAEHSRIREELGMLNCPICDEDTDRALIFDRTEIVDSRCVACANQPHPDFIPFDFPLLSENEMRYSRADPRPDDVLNPICYPHAAAPPIGDVKSSEHRDAIREAEALASLNLPY